MGLFGDSLFPRTSGTRCEAIFCKDCRTSWMFRLEATVHFIYFLYLLRLLHQSRAICMVKTLWETFPKEGVCSPSGKVLFLRRKFYFSPSSMTSAAFFCYHEICAVSPESKLLPGSLRLTCSVRGSEKRLQLFVSRQLLSLHRPSAAPSGCNLSILLSI